METKTRMVYRFQKKKKEKPIKERPYEYLFMNGISYVVLNDPKSDEPVIRQEILRLIKKEEEVVVFLVLGE